MNVHKLILKFFNYFINKHIMEEFLKSEDVLHE